MSKISVIVFSLLFNFSTEAAVSFDPSDEHTIEEFINVVMEKNEFSIRTFIKEHSAFDGGYMKIAQLLLEMGARADTSSIL